MNKILEGLQDAVNTLSEQENGTVLRFYITEARIDSYEVDRVIFDRLEGKVVRQYDLGDPANYSSSHGGTSDSEWFVEKGLDRMEKIAASDAKPIPQYAPPDDDYWDDPDYPEQDDEVDEDFGRDV